MGEASERRGTAMYAVAASSRSMPARSRSAAPGRGGDERPAVAAAGRVEALDATRERRLSFAALSLPPIAAATCVGLSQMSRGQPC
jgi:hypothetical protein